MSWCLPTVLIRVFGGYSMLCNSEHARCQGSGFGALPAIEEQVLERA